MSADLLARLEELETRLAFQEHALNQLSDALAAARAEDTTNALLMQRMRDELQQMRLSLAAQSPGMDPAQEPPPPHY